MIGKACSYEIQILPSDNWGFHVRIGCANLVYEGIDTLLVGLETYLRDPKSKEQEYNKVNKGWDGQSLPDCNETVTKAHTQDH